MESINGLYKTECIRTTVFHPGAFKALADVEFATAGWVDWFNHRRLHSSLTMKTLPSSSRTTTLPSTPWAAPHESGGKTAPVQGTRPELPVEGGIFGS
jgi:Integrase core domain